MLSSGRRRKRLARMAQGAPAIQDDRRPSSPSRPLPSISWTLSLAPQTPAIDDWNFAAESSPAAPRGYEATHLREEPDLQRGGRPEAVRAR